MFSTTNLFKHIPCPWGDNCELTNCMYAHSERPAAIQSQSISSTQPPVSGEARLTRSAHDLGEPPNKRRKVTYDTLQDKAPSKADLLRRQIANTKSSGPVSDKQENARDSKTRDAPAHPPSSLSRTVSPPPTRATLDAGSGCLANSNGHKAGSHDRLKQEGNEALNPRLIGNDPVGHQFRSNSLKLLHAEMTKLNQKVANKPDLAYKAVLHLSEQQLIKLALAQEEKIALESGQVYRNVMSQRVVALRKMSLEDWINDIKAKMIGDRPEPTKHQGKAIDTGLPAEQECLILPKLVEADQRRLAQYGYIPEPPTAEQAAEAVAAVQASKNWEVCDRCSSRFQVFPDRDEEGRLSSNGPCKHHPSRKVFPQRSKTDKETGEKQPYYPCCGEAIGSPGCNETAEHVFKTSSPARLAATLPFICTPENPSPAKDRRGRQVRAVTFDCEMGHTTQGLELIRLTAVSWPSGEPLLDILVRPLGAVMDLNSRFSGVFPEHFQNAVDYDDWITTPPPPRREDGMTALPIVSSPQRARELLCSFLTPQTPLIGHAIDNDLNTVRLCHPTIIDTVLLFAHPRGLPLRFGLKMLTQKHLGRAIQTGGTRGHDSLEDAVATGDLVRVKVGETWRRLRAEGWTIAKDQLLPPLDFSEIEQDAETSSPDQQTKQTVVNTMNGKKRKQRSSSGASESSEMDHRHEPSGSAVAEMVCK